MLIETVNKEKLSIVMKEEGTTIHDKLGLRTLWSHNQIIQANGRAHRTKKRVKHTKTGQEIN